MIVVLEVAKLIASVALYAADTRALESQAHGLSFQWALPAGCYAAVNGLGYAVISIAGTTRYALLSHLKVVPTALLAHAFLARPLTRLQWLAMCIVGVGLAACDYSRLDGNVALLNFDGAALALPLSAVAAVLSAAASVYSEYGEL